MNVAAESVGTAGVPAPEQSGRGLARVLTHLPELAALLTTVWAFRSVLVGGKLPGNIGDARWTIALHEHWYRVWGGHEAVRDLHFYFPMRNTLGSSDAFLVQGQLYSLARILGLDLVDAWVVAGVGFFLIGAFGVAVLSRRVLESLWLQVAFVLLCVGSYAMQTGFGHVQLFGMLSASWMFVGLADLVGGRHFRRGMSLLVVVPPVLALSSWYAMLLTAIILLFLALSLALVSSRTGIAREVRRVGADVWRTLRTIAGVALAGLFVLLWGAVLWVYVPSMGLLPAPLWLDVQIYSPRWSDLWNASGGGGGIWSSLYARLPLQESVNDQKYGFTPIVFLAFFVSALAVLRSALLRRPRPARTPSAIGRAGLLAATLTVLGVLAFFLMDERGFSLFRLPWRLVPGMDSIRSPYRVMIILFGFVVLVVLRSFELWWSGRRWAAQSGWRRVATLTGAGILVALVFLEMQRPVDAQRARGELLSPELLSPGLLAQVDRIRDDCDALIVVPDSPETPSWMNAIDAVILSTVSGVPTPQGYSRSDPVGYPDQDAGVDAAALDGWMRAEGFGGRACAASSRGVQILPGG